MAWPDFTYDIYEDGEDSTLDELAEVDTTGRLALADTSQYYLGTHSHEIDHSSQTAEATLGLTGKAYASVSVGFAYRRYTSITWNWGPRIITFVDSAWTAYYLNAGREAANNNVRAFCMNQSDAGAITGVDDLTWYWITARYIRNDNVTFRVYDAAHSQVGNDLTVEAPDLTCQIVTIGSDSEGATSASYSYIDDIVVDYTDGTFPLLGWEVGGGGSIVPQAMYYRRLRSRRPA
ncbi:MAG: hypothetical protein PHD37_17315 [Gallionellaceae bacterium]|nr:hypothetical protein [Gallionellaceae bacterium]